MPGGATFSELLDERLADVRETPATARVGTYRPPPVIGFFAFTPDFNVTKVHYANGTTLFEAARAAQAARSFTSPTWNTPRPESRPHVATPAPQSRPVVMRAPRRVLSAKDQMALRELVQLGATIDADFTADDLRHAFRTLARQYHPDRHPDVGSDERARLATTFGRVHAAYSRLKLTARDASVAAR